MELLLNKLHFTKRSLRKISLFFSFVFSLKLQEDLVCQMLNSRKVF